jgi:hypothetical protein
MPDNYSLRHNSFHLNSGEFHDDSDAASTADEQTSPAGPRDPPPYYVRPALFLTLTEKDFGNEDSDDDYGAHSHGPKASDKEKTLAFLNLMSKFNKFSLNTLFTVLFTLEAP